MLTEVQQLKINENKVWNEKQVTKSETVLNCFYLSI